MEIFPLMLTENRRNCILSIKQKPRLPRKCAAVVVLLDSAILAFLKEAVALKPIIIDRTGS